MVNAVEALIGKAKWARNGEAGEIAKPTGIDTSVRRGNGKMANRLGAKMVNPASAIR